MAGITDCSVCLDKYLQPKMLPCQHVYCLRCLRQLRDSGTIKCPQCRANHRVPSNGVDGFPNSLLMMSLLSSPTPTADGPIQPMPSSPTGPMNLPCMECDSGRNLQQYCKHCDRYLCNSCHWGHLQEVIGKIGSDMNRFQHNVHTFEKGLRIMDEREGVLQPVKRQINEWREKCINEVDCKATSLIENLDSRMKIDERWRRKACETKEEIEKFRADFPTTITQSTEMAYVLGERKRLERLNERSRELVKTMKNLEESRPKLQFDADEARRVQRAISGLKGVLEIKRPRVRFDGFSEFGNFTHSFSDL